MLTVQLANAQLLAVVDGAVDSQGPDSADPSEFDTDNGIAGTTGNADITTIWEGLCQARIDKRTIKVITEEGLDYTDIITMTIPYGLFVLQEGYSVKIIKDLLGDPVTAFYGIKSITEDTAVPYNKMYQCVLEDKSHALA